MCTVQERGDPHRYGSRAGSEAAVKPRTTLALFVLALGIRLLHLAEIGDTPYFDTLILDAYEYDGLSNQLLRGNWFLVDDGGYVHGPLYPYLLALLKLAGANHAGIRFFQALLDAGSCVLLCRVAAAFFPAPVPLVAGLFAAFYWPFIFFSGELLATGLVLFLELALVLALLRCRKRPSAGNAAAAGLLLGLLVLTRSNTLLLLPVAGWWLYRVKTSRRYLQLGAFAAALAIVLCPFIARNYLVQGSALPFQGGWSFYMGNNPDADGTPYARQGIVWQRLELLPVRAGHTTPARKGEWYLREGMRYIGSDPAAYLQLLFRKFRLFWHAYEIPVSADMRFIETHSRLYPFLVLHFGILGPLAVAGMLWNLPRFNHCFPLYGFVCVFLLNCLLFSVCARYRLPALPFLIVFAAAGLWQLKEWAASRRFDRGVVFLLLLVGGSAILVHTGVDPNRVDHLRSPWLLTHVYLRQQQHDLAHQALLPALHAYPDDPDVFNSLGVVYEHQDLPQKAEAAFGRALQYAPDHTRARINLGKLYFRRQRLDEALATLQEALPHDSRKEARYEVNYQLGLVYLQRQEYERALHAFRNAIRAHRGAPAYYGLSAAVGALGRPQDQMRALQWALERDPTFAPAYRNLGALHLQQGRLTEAEKMLEQAVRHDPASSVAHRHLGQLYLKLRRKELARHHFETARQLQGTVASSP